MIAAGVNAIKYKSLPELVGGGARWEKWRTERSLVGSIVTVSTIQHSSTAGSISHCCVGSLWKMVSRKFTSTSRPMVVDVRAGSATIWAFLCCFLLAKLEI